MSTTYANTINGNAIYAERSVQDKDGNQIDTTYAKVASLATVASTGDYGDLLNKPTIPTVDQSYNASSTNAQAGVAVAGAIANVRQVPSTTSSDNGKVLGVTDTSGTLGWVSAGGSQVQSDWTETDTTDPSYIQNKPDTDTLVAGANISLNTIGDTVTVAAMIPSAGNMLTLTANTYNVTTTAGITDIQRVTSLPAVPSTTVLYLIPET